MSPLSPRNPIAIGVALIVALLIVTSSVAVVPEWQQAVILRLNRPVGIANPFHPGEKPGHSQAGLIFKIPFIDNVVYVDKRVLSVDLPEQQVLSVDQQRLKVDAFARFRIVDPLRMVVAAGTEARVVEQLGPILGSALRNELAKREFVSLLSPERGQVMQNIRAELDDVAREYGAQIVDVRIKQAELPEGSPLESALNRMRTARNQQAQTIAAQGFKRAQIVKADAEAEAAQIYAQSFGKDPKFYDFWRAMQSYRRTFGVDGGSPTGDTSIILSPDNDYLKQFEGR